MSLPIHVTVADAISPDLARKARSLANLRPVLEAIGLQLNSIAIRAFRDASLRASVWPPKRDGTPAMLYKSGALKHSIRNVEVTNAAVTVGSDRQYAAVQQLGDPRTRVIKAKGQALAFMAGGALLYRKSVNRGPIPARPFFPFLPSGEMLPAARAKTEAVARAKLNSLLR